MPDQGGLRSKVRHRDGSPQVKCLATRRHGARPVRLRAYFTRTKSQLTGLPSVALTGSAQGLTGSAQERKGRKGLMRQVTLRTANRGNMFPAQIVIGIVLAVLFAMLGLP